MDTVVCPICWGSGFNVDTCTLCDGSGVMLATQESVTAMFKAAAEAMANVEHQGPSERLSVPLGWENGDYMMPIGRSEEARRILVNAEALIIIAHATGLAGSLKSG